MDLLEYKKISNLNYDEYCEYLKTKYGVVNGNYYSPKFTKNNRITRTSDGLIIHHTKEDSCVMLSTKEIAMLNPIEWQHSENLVYCDYLEHLLLHILITEESPIDSGLGIGGVYNFIAPELNDVYSGFLTKQQWRDNLHKKIINDKDTYFELISRYKKSCSHKKLYDYDKLCSSYNEKYGLWSDINNLEIYEAIDSL